MGCSSGLYVVTLNNHEPISANADDKRRSSKAIKVNKENCKFGKSVNLERRKENYYKTFGKDNVNFVPIVSLIDVDSAEDEILKKLFQYRQVSPSGNLTEWMKGISIDDVITLVLSTLNKLGLSYNILNAKGLGIEKMTNQSKVTEESTSSQSKLKSIKQTGFVYTLPSNYQFDDQTQKTFQLIVEKKKPVVFLTGRAGTGKTTFIHYIKKNYTGKSVILTPTGMTALNIGGQTIHSFFRFPPRTFESDEIGNYYNKAVDHIDLIIIDEISMVQSDVIDHIDFALRKWRKSSVPFAGIQLLLIGDCFQLSPWIKFGAEKKRFEEKYRSQWFFDANIFNNVTIDSVSLTNIYRQKDQRFINILNRIRIKWNHEEFIKELNQRCYFEKQGEDIEEQLILTTTNARADVVNAQKLKQINSDSRIYLATKNGKITKEINKMVPEKLELKVGSQVMVTKNIEGVANGTLAIVKEMLDDKIIIETLVDFLEVTCHIEVWEQYKYEWDNSSKKITSQKTGEYNQFPLRLGWAITIHKSQGLTFDSIKIDLTGGAFSPGQTYVALSRCRTLERITLDKPIALSDVLVDPLSIEFYTKIMEQNSTERVEEVASESVDESLKNTVQSTDSINSIESKTKDQSHMKIKLHNIATKILVKDDLAFSFAIKASVENNTEKNNISFVLQALDNDGFLLYEKDIEGIIPAGLTRDLTEKETYFDRELFNQIKEWRIKETNSTTSLNVSDGYEDFDKNIPF